MKSRLSRLAGATFCALALAMPAFADAPAGYYNSLEGKTGVELKKAVKAIVRKHTVISGHGQKSVAEPNQISLIPGT